MALQSVANVISNQAIRGLRMGTVKYGPVAAAATQLFLHEADESRQFKRDDAIASENALTEEEERTLEEGADLTGEPRSIRVFCQTIRSSREAFNTTGINIPVPLFSHWCLEIEGICYELREHIPAEQSNAENYKRRKILYQEVGLESRKIRLEVSTNRTIHPNTKYWDEVSTTTLSDDKILWAASLIFGRFGSGYDLFVDNCQHFTQLLAEAICGRENRADVRRFFEKRSVMKLPVAASWLAAPVYGCTKALHYALKPETPNNSGEIYQKVGTFLESMENFYLHPRVLAARNRQNPFS